MRDLHRDLLVLAQHHRRVVAAVVHERVVQAAEARARIQRDVGKPIALDQVDNDVGLPTAVVLGVHWETILSTALTYPLTPLGVTGAFSTLRTFPTCECHQIQPMLATHPLGWVVYAFGCRGGPRS